MSSFVSQTKVSAVGANSPVFPPTKGDSTDFSDSPFVRRFVVRVSNWLKTPVDIESLCGHHCKIGGTLHPQSVDDVRAIAEAASDAAGLIKLQPISCGKNWGFGSRVPTADNVFVLDLSRLNKIRSSRVEGHSVELEPGVTQGQLDEWLARQNRTHFFNVTGAGSQTSIIGNALEKGIGYAGLRQHDFVEMEVVLPDGRLLRTSKYLAPSPQGLGISLGPELGPLFLQSNLGIVTAARIELFLRPEKMGAVLCKVYDRSKFPPLMDIISGIMAEEINYGTPHVFNRSRITSSFGPFLDSLGRQELLASTADWTALLPIKGPSIVFDATATALSERLSPFGQVEIMIGTAGEETSKLGSVVAGQPNDFSLASVTFSAFGEIKEAASLEATGAGLIHVTPCVALNGMAVARAIQLAEEVLESEGFKDIAMSLNVLSARAAALVISISFDRRSRKETVKAQAAATAILKRFAEQSIFPYRLGLNQAAYLPSMSETAAEVLLGVQGLFDPNRCMASSRYEPLWNKSY